MTGNKSQRQEMENNGEGEGNKGGGKRGISPRGELRTASG